MASISTMPCRVLLRCAHARGFEESTLCSTAGVDPTPLGDREARVPMSYYYALFEALAETVNDDYIGLDIVRHVAPEDYGVLGYLFMTSVDVGQAYERLFRFQRLVADPVMSMHVEAGRVHVVCELWGTRRPAHNLVSDAFASEVVEGFRLMCGSEHVTEIDYFSPRSGGDISPYIERLGLKPRLSAEKPMICFDESLLKLPVKDGNAGLSAVLEEQAELLTNLLPPSPVGTPGDAQHVRELLIELLPSGVPRIEDVAKRLGQSPRSLQRHLRSEGTSLKRLVDELRREACVRHLRRGLGTTQTAFLLGFSELSGFHRAFKRWTGMTPRAWLKREAGRGLP